MRSVSSSIALAERIAELERVIEALGSGRPEIGVGIADLAIRRARAEMDVLLLAEPVLVDMLRKHQDQPAAIGSITRSAAASELVRRGLLTAHERMADAGAR